MIMPKLERGVARMKGGMIDCVRPTAQAGAQVLYDQVVQNVAGIGVKTGNLKRSIYQVYAQNRALNNNPKRATYIVSWNAKKAPHGGLIEYGHIQRYMAYINSKGQWKTMVRPEMRGKPKPKRKASREEKDAYYMPRKNGPVQWVARSFIRKATEQFPEAELAMKQRFYAEIRARGVFK
jgi:hypothetical protein